MKDIAPDVYRQRMSIEGLRDKPFTTEEICAYLVKLGEVLDMLPLAMPYTNLSEKYGWSAWMHWETSGVHFYSWDKREPVFFSVDIYTCKKFDYGMAENFTKKYFSAKEVVSKEVTL
jgi:S-adenosylmethionine decarboxylase